MNETGHRGLNVVALNSRDHSVLLARSYDTFANAQASSDLIRDLKGVRKGSIIIAAVKDEASKSLSQEVKELFTKWGSKEVNALGFREAWGFI